MVRIFVFVLLFFSVVHGYSQRGDYSRVKMIATTAQFDEAVRLGVALDHLMLKTKSFFIGEFSAREIDQMTGLGMTAEYLIPDLRHYFAHQNDGLDLSSMQKTASTPANWNYGGMGGYLTLAQVYQEIDSMVLLYPSLVSVKDTIGLSIEGRPIVMIKISDNPNVDESEPEALYDAVHHAREPGSVMQMVYFMWHILENYGTDDEITYLINNREMYFVPMLNPDGYFYNQTTDPSGGGMWRKNRRNNGGGTWGVDLNRNYDHEWGYDNIGSSPDPSSDTYRGTAGFSEPETQAMRDFCNSHEFKIALNYHTYGDLLVYPWGYLPSFLTPDSNLFRDFGAVLTEDNFYTYGTGDETVGYVVNGDSDDWMYGEQVSKPKIMSMTPEVGNAAEGFWPPISSIIPNCEINLQMNKRNAWLAGDYIRVQGQPHEAYSGTAVWFPTKFTNLGLVSAGAATAVFTTTSPAVVSVNNTVSLPALSTSAFALDSFSLTLAPGIPQGTEIPGVIELTYAGGYVQYDTVSFIYGTPVCVFTETAETGTSAWYGMWGRSSTVSHTGTYSMTDSPSGDYFSTYSNEYQTATFIDLTGYTVPSLEFWTRYEIEAGWDYCQLEISTNGSTWTPLDGQYTTPGGGWFQPTGEPLYDGIRGSWVKEKVNLDAWAGVKIWIRFQMVSDDFTEMDGYYFDDLKVCGYTDLVGTNPPAADGAAWLYPNPASGTIRLKSSGEATVRLTDLSGKTVFRARMNNGSAADVSALPAGVYLFGIESGEGTVSGKLILR